jgi:hypothetical protein
MNLLRCENGHFYDGDAYNQCPHCGAQSRNDDLTVGLTQATIDEAETSMLPQATGEPLLASIVQQSTDYRLSGADDSATVGYYDQSLGSEPAVGWLVCISKGSNLGKDYRLKSGRNFIGRAQNMDVSIGGDDTVSRDKHAIVVYEPKTCTYLVQVGDAKELSYLNDKLVISSVELNPNDIITIGNTKLMFIPFCSAIFNWEMLQKED